MPALFCQLQRIWGWEISTHLVQPCLTRSLHSTLRDLGFSGVTFSKCDVSQGTKLSLQDEQENPGSGRAGLLQHPSLEVVKVFTLPSPGPLGQRWCSSYRPDKAAKQTAKKTQPPCILLVFSRDNFAGVSVLSHLASGRSFNC